MKSSPIIISFFIFLFSPIYSQKSNKTFSELVHSADSLYKTNNYLESAFLFEKTIAEYPGKISKNELYNAACSWAKAGNGKKAVDLLEKAVNNYGYSDFRHMLEDSDLDLLHNDKKWQGLIAKAKKSYAQEYNLKLEEELDSIYYTDQLYRNKLDSVQKGYGVGSQQWNDLLSKIEEQDRINELKVTDILIKEGWPGPFSANGQKISRLHSYYIFLILQHSTLDTQLKFLTVLKEAAKKGNARKRDYAYVMDRILMRQNKRQLYGTQLSYNKEQKEVFVWPIENVDDLDKRRISLGLSSMEAEMKLLHDKTWNLDLYKSQLSTLEKYCRIR